MKSIFWWIGGLLSLLSMFLIPTSFTSVSPVEEKLTGFSLSFSDSLYQVHVRDLYKEAHLRESGLRLDVFEKALMGFYNLKQQTPFQSKSILSIVDFDQVSTSKRMYVIDLKEKKMLFHTWVAHGEKSGSNFAHSFSNQPNSFSSSLGFYLTGEIYKGIHGQSLRLDGMDQGFNDKARERAIVIHGAPYVSNATIKALGRLGRSQGCPAISPALADTVIHTIADKTVLFIHKSETPYFSRYLNQESAVHYALNAAESSFFMD